MDSKLITSTKKANMNIPALIDYLDSDAVHITIDRNGNFGLLQEAGHCAPKGRYYSLLNDNRRNLVLWLLKQSLVDSDE
jgi:hypothetical protein